MSEDEKTMCFLESQIPALAGSAFADARLRILASGQSVMQAKNGVIYEVFPDGSQVERKRISPPRPAKKGTLIRLS
ncbi:MAG: hypothetical protein LBK99_02895 [Opitutaceae bacterium]|jgi:hypothetical protein|nr:hypothetical protein [Opitutaceae bacterium]